MSLSITMTSAEIAALVYKYSDLKSAVLAKYFAENVPTLEITDLESDSETESDADSSAADAATEPAATSAN